MAAEEDMQIASKHFRYVQRELLESHVKGTMRYQNTPVRMVEHIYHQVPVWMWKTRLTQTSWGGMLNWQFL